MKLGFAFTQTAVFSSILESKLQGEDSALCLYEKFNSTKTPEYNLFTLKLSMEM